MITRHIELASRARQATVWAAAMLAVLCFSSGSVGAQNLKVGVVNVVRLLEESPQAQAVNTALRDEFAPRQRDLEATERQLREKQETFQRDASVMGAEERLRLEREIRDGQRELQRAENELLEDANIRRNERWGELQRTLLQQVQQFAQEQEYDLIVTDALFYSDEVDVTAQVLEMLRRSSPR